MSGTPIGYGQQPAAPAVGIPAGVAPPIRRRHPLGLPAGSVRALLILMVVGTIWALLLMPADAAGKPVYVPLYLYYLLFLTSGVYFGARGHAPHPSVSQEPPPLFLPRGSIRLLIIASFIGVTVTAFTRNHDFFNSLLIDPNEKPTMLIPIVLLGAFFLGVMVNGVCHLLLAGPEGMPPWYQDVLAWVSVLAVLGLGVAVILELVVSPSMENPIKLPHEGQIILTGIIAFYFGARTS